MTDPRAIACRCMWASAVLAFLADWNRAHAAARRSISPRPTPQQIEDTVRRWFSSEWGQEVCALAGVDVDASRALELVRLSRADFARKMRAPEDRQHQGTGRIWVTRKGCVA